MVEKEKVCPHCDFLNELFNGDTIQSNREYWLMTEVFVYLHGGKDFCEFTKLDNTNNS